MYIYLNFEPNKLSHKIQINESDLLGYAPGELYHLSKSNDKKAPDLRVVTEPVGRVTCKIMEHSHVCALRML